MRSYYSKEKPKYGDMSYESKYLLDTKYMTKRDLQKYYRYYNKTNSRSQLKKIVILIVGLCFFLYIFVDYNLKNKFRNLRNRFDYVPRTNAEYNISHAYFVNTPGCQMPHFDVTNDNILQFMYKPQNFSCKKPLTRTSDVGAELWLNMNEQELLDYFNISNIESTSCEYTELKRLTDDKNEYLQRVEFNLEFNKSIHIKPGIEFIRVDCYTADGQSFYRDFHFFIDEHKDVMKNSKKSVHLKMDADEKVSVMIIGIDSVSHLNFLRQMRKTADYIHSKLTHVEFWGYNKVGDNTYPNLIPMLSGLDESELNLSCLAPVRQANYDKCAFIWRRFKDMDFKTAYGEDVASLGLFNFFRPGFKQQPTDYYLRPVMAEMEKYISYKQSVNVELCKGGRQTAGVVLEMIRKLTPLLQVQNFFSFFWTVTLTHDLLNMPMLLDDDVFNILQQFENSQVLNRSVIFLISDHGLRWGSFRKTYQGMMEERQPLLITLYPKWFKSKYPKAVENLELNARRLSTPFDVYETLKDLLHMSSLSNKQISIRESEFADMESLPRGISLFLPIPETRSCENAAIAAHWCTCHHKQELATNDARVQRAARYIVKLINARLKPYPQCRILYLHSISEANIAAPHHKIVKDITSDYGIDITLRIQTKPGLGLYESTVRMTSFSIVLTGTISRLNLYNSQSFCIDDNATKMFCYCHR